MFYLRLTDIQGASNSDKSHIYDTLIFRDDSVFGLFTENNNWIIGPVNEIYSKHKTYHIDLWVDMLRKTVTCYKDNQFFDKLRLNENLNSLHGVIMAAGTAGAVVSNLRIEEGPGYDEEFDFEGISCPDYINDSVYVAYDAESEAGNIYYNPSDISFGEKIINRKSSIANFKVKYEVYDSETGELVYETSEDLTVNGSGKFSRSKRIDLFGGSRQYGLFTLKVSFIDEAANETAEYETNFSLVRKTDRLNSKMGVHTQFGHGYADADININLLYNAGFSNVRDYVAHSQYNNENSWTLPQRYTQWDKYASSYNISELLHIDSENFPKTANERAEVAEYASNLAKNSNAEYIEIYNELNVSSSVTPENYAEALIDISDAIVKESPDTKIVAMATARVGAEAQSWIEDVLEVIEAKNLNPADYIDVVSVHPYKKYNRSPETGQIANTDETDGNLKEQISGVREIMNAHGLENAEIFATEIGWTSSKNISGWANAVGIDDRVSEREQAEYSIRASVLLHNAVDKFYWHTLNNKRNADDYEENFGLTKCWEGVEIPYEAKPAYVALANFNAILGDAELVEESVSNQCYNSTFVKNGKRIHVMWSENDKDTITVSTGTRIMKVYDIYGNESYISSLDGIYEIELSTSPIYVEELVDEFKLIMTNENGVETSSFDYPVKATLIAENGLSDFQDGLCLIEALYKDNVLIGCTSKKIERDTAANTIFSTDAVFAKDVDTCKLFLWTNEMKPVLAKEIKNREAVK